MEFLRRQVLEPGRLKKEWGWLNMDIYSGQTGCGRWTVMPQPERPLLLGRGRRCERKARTRGSCTGKTEGQAVSKNQRRAIRIQSSRLNGVAPDDLSGRFEQEARVEQRGNRMKESARLARGSRKQVEETTAVVRVGPISHEEAQTHDPKLVLTSRARN